MNDKDEALSLEQTLRLALEALESASNAIESWGSYASEYFQDKHDLQVDINNTQQAITAIKAALEAKDEPVAWMYPDDLKRFETSEACAEAYSIEMVSPTQGETVPLYTTPPQRQWVGLTDGEIEKHWKKQVGTVRPNYSFTRAIESKLKEKNT